MAFAKISGVGLDDAGNNMSSLGTDTILLSFDELLERIMDLHPEEIDELPYLLKGIPQLIHILDKSQLNILLTEQNPTILEGNKLELITVIMITNVSCELRRLISEPLIQDNYKKCFLLLNSLTGLFKYHFQLSIDNNNYAFKNFGYILATLETNIIEPFLKLLNLNPPFERVRTDKFEKIFTLILILHCFSKPLYGGLLLVFQHTDSLQEIEKIFKLNIQIDSENELKGENFENFSVPSINELYQRFRFMSNLEKSTMETDPNFENLLGTLFFSSFQRLIIGNFIKGFRFFKNAQVHLVDLRKVSLKSFEHTLYLDFLVLSIYHNTYLLEWIKATSTNTMVDQNTRDSSMFLLIKISELLFLQSDILKTEDENIEKEILGNLNVFYYEIAGIENYKVQFNLANMTLMPLLELRDQNLKLNYLEELNFLKYLKLSLLNIFLNLENEDSFLKLNSLFVDTGCSISIGSFFDIIQSILVIIICNLKFKNKNFHEIPKEYIKQLNLDFIPPVNRSDMSFTDNFKTEKENFGEFYQMLIDTDKCKIYQNENCLKLLENCMVYVTAIKCKIYHQLYILNNQSNILRVPNAFEKLQFQFETETEEIDGDSSINFQPKDQLFKYRTPLTKIAMFKAGESIIYKLLNYSINLFSMSNLCVLIIADNYKIMKNKQKNNDFSLSRFFGEFTVDFFTVYTLIYQEFGILNLFKMVRSLNETNLKFIAPTSLMISKLLSHSKDATTCKRTGSKSENNNNHRNNNKENIIDNSNSNYNSNFNDIADCNHNLTESFNNNSSSSTIQNRSLTPLSFNSSTTISFNSYDTNEQPTIATLTISEIISKSIMSSNLIRQFVELFDDGSSKSFKSLHKFLKMHPSTLKPSKIPKGNIKLNIDNFLDYL
ncbi:hypothetical protein DAMA08_007350 [Martiniozyma asiatica (nom. inval.)]|nr:hypothetical protein DAMA08_007350 [Martiniozyma asiatica]